jgi:hypothetical protein
MVCLEGLVPVVQRRGGAYRKGSLHLSRTSGIESQYNELRHGASHYEYKAFGIMEFFRHPKNLAVAIAWNLVCRRFAVWLCAFIAPDCIHVLMPADCFISMQHPC